MDDFFLLGRGKREEGKRGGRERGRVKEEGRGEERVGRIALFFLFKFTKSVLPVAE